MHRLSAVVFLSLLLLAACGGGGGNRTTPGGGGNPGGGGTPATCSSSATGATAVNVTSGSTASGTNICLPSPASSPSLNAKMIGAAVPAGSGSTSITLTNAPAVIRLGALPASGQMVIALTGDGITTSGASPTLQVTSVTLSGPSDITVGTPSALQSGGGLGFRITLGGSTATGARTIYLKNAQGDITAYSGGLEILP